MCVDEDLGVVLIPTRGDASDVDRVLSAAVRPGGVLAWLPTVLAPGATRGWQR